MHTINVEMSPYAADRSSIRRIKVESVSDTANKRFQRTIDVEMVLNAMKTVSHIQLL